MSMNFEIIPAEKFDFIGNAEYYKNLGKEKIAKYIRKDHGSIVSFKYGNVSKAHIYVDDHCYIVAIYGGTYIDRSGKEKKFYHPTTHIFPEALEVLKTLDSKI